MLTTLGISVAAAPVMAAPPFVGDKDAVCIGRAKLTTSFSLPGGWLAVLVKISSAHVLTSVQSSPGKSAWENPVDEMSKGTGVYGLQPYGGKWPPPPTTNDVIPVLGTGMHTWYFTPGSSEIRISEGGKYEYLGVISCGDDIKKAADAYTALVQK